MPRLLLVDDNPSIHKIAETLLTATDISLVCAASGAEALDLVARGEHFDVALVDTSMAGMDGWELLNRLRGARETALLPIAMMAGVLDVVDPGKVEQAPIQGFLKKPVELRDLADRVRTLLATPVKAPETNPNYATVPAFRVADHPFPESAATSAPETPEDDLLILDPSDLHLEDAPEPVDEPVVELAAAPVAAPEPPAEPMPATLDLEELDFEGLRSLTPPAPVLPDIQIEVADPHETPTKEAFSPLPELAAEDTFGAPSINLEDALGVVTSSLPDLGPSLELPEAEPVAEAAAPTPLAALPTDWSDESDTLLELTAATLTGSLDEAPGASAAAEVAAIEPPVQEAPVAVAPVAESLVAHDLVLDEATAEDLDLEAPALEAPAAEEPPVEAPAAEAPSIEVPVAVEGPTVEVPVAIEDFTLPAGLITEMDLPELPAEGLPAVPEPPAPAWAAFESQDDRPTAQELDAPALPEDRSEVHAAGLSDGQTDPLAAILADPVQLDRLARAVVARLGDQALREIAWEVMPDLAARLQRN